jgi:hypothetical protein
MFVSLAPLGGIWPWMGVDQGQGYHSGEPLHESLSRLQRVARLER